MALFHAQIHGRTVTSITQNKFKQICGQHVDRCRALLLHKIKGYTHYNAKWLLSFRGAAAVQSYTLGYALVGIPAKHMFYLYGMCFFKNVVLRPEKWDEKITDSINYLMLLQAIVKDVTPCG